MKGKFLKSILLLLLLCTPQVPYAQSTQASGTINGHEYVDLGLSVMWATCNVGASSPEDYGNYYAWGETSPKPVYTTMECTTCKENMGDIAGNPNYDAARANWGDTWRLPTKKEIQELIDNCTTEWTTLKGIKGRLFTSKINGNSIFLPASSREYGYYWSSSPAENDSHNFDAYRLYFYSGHIDIGKDYRYHERSVRPVTEGSATTKQQTQIASPPPSNGYINGHEYVDLGLSVKWATCNVGASTPEDYGNYYAWGEIRPKSTYTEKSRTTYNDNNNMGDIAGNPNYDAARANWGDTWRLPTKEEFQELINKCKRTWTTQGGHNGYKITGPNGNSIFLPAMGFRYGSSLIYAGEYGRYWSSSPGGSQSACNLLFDNECFGWDFFTRCDGRGVRPVSDGSTMTKQQLQIASLPNGDIDGHEYVDLGLSVKWATCNVGASTSEDYGDYFAWGETKQKNEYTRDNCATYKENMGDIAGNPNYDAVRANWGGTWRLPTKEEIQELFDNCTIERVTTLNDVNGTLFTSKINGNSIFLPATGERSGSWLKNIGESGFYWSSLPNESNVLGPYGIRIEGNGRIFLSWDDCYNGRSVRPVSDGSATTKQQTQIASPPSNGYINGHEYVDLGLSVKWATCNVGASLPEEYGKYYAWGETKNKSEYTDKNCFTYNKDMGDIAGNPNYDAVRANWGGTWRMPTLNEIQELMNNCNIKWTTRNGINGILITSKKNGNSIFLPAAGYCSKARLCDVGEDGRYWSSSPKGDLMQSAYNFRLFSANFGWQGSSRSFGYSVRPVTE